jgi:two-component system NtrC family sensor kinase
MMFLALGVRGYFLTIVVLAVLASLAVVHLVAAPERASAGLAGMATIGMLLLAAVIRGGEVLLRRRIDRLVATARAVAAGDVTARTGWPDAHGELRPMARALDDLAEVVERLALRTQRVLEQVGDAILGVDADERITFINPVAATLLGGPAGELIGRSLHGALRDTRPTGAACALCATLAEGEARHGADGLLVTAPGASVAVEYTCTPKRAGDPDGGVVVALKDIRERKRTDLERQRQRDSLHQRDKLAAMATLLADVAHELNNPLTVIIAGAALLRDSAVDDATRKRVELIEQAAERCVLTIRNFLGLVRQHPETRQEVALERVVKDTLALVAQQLEVDEVTVETDLAPDLPTVSADPHQLHQVVLNLVTNARHALRAAPPPRRLSITTRHDAATGRVVLAVADSGPGVPPELRAYVFRPFFTTKSPEEGTGLGLALSHDIVTAHGGGIRVETAPGGGARFIVELPAGWPPTLGAAGRPRLAPGPRRQGRVLVVDDDAELAGVLAAVLRADGHDVETAPNGAEALTRLEARPFDVVLSDVRMPRLDGPGLYRELERRHPEMLPRLVFLTGDVLGAQTVAFLERTQARHLTKPFDVKQVRRAVQDVLER